MCICSAATLAQIVLNSSFRQVPNLVQNVLRTLGTNELMLVSCLLYQLRSLERLWGTRRFITFIFVSTSIAASLHWLQRFWVRSLPPLLAPAPEFVWPIVLSCALLVRYLTDTPLFVAPYRFTSFVAPGLGAAIAASSPSAAGLGIAAGCLAAVLPPDLLPIPLTSRAALLLASIADVPPRPPSPPRPRIPPQPQGGIPPQPEGAGAPRQVPRAPAAGGGGEALKSLVEMGAPREVAEQVLAAVGGDMERAVEVLFS